MAANDIQLNPSKPSELEFEVIIQDIGIAEIPVTRFVILSSDANCDYSFRCTKVEGEKNKWSTKLPALTFIPDDTSKFRVEVIIDGYYFEPATGEIAYIRSPEVQFKDRKAPKPSVTASFTVKQEEPDKKPTKLEKTPVKEASGGGEITGMYAPTNSLLKREEDPTVNGRMRGNTSVNDEFTDEDRLNLDKAKEMSSSITPGEGIPYPQEDGKNEEEFDPKRIANSIVKSAMGNEVKKPTTKGSLFKRDADGNAVIAGLESEASKQQLKNNAEKVKNILGST